MSIWVLTNKDGELIDSVVDLRSFNEQNPDMQRVQLSLTEWSYDHGKIKAVLTEDVEDDLLGELIEDDCELISDVEYHGDYEDIQDLEDDQEESYE